MLASRPKVGLLEPSERPFLALMLRAASSPTGEGEQPLDASRSLRRPLRSGLWRGNGCGGDTEQLTYPICVVPAFRVDQNTGLSSRIRRRRGRARSVRLPSRCRLHEQLVVADHRHHPTGAVHAVLSEHRPGVYVPSARRLIDDERYGFWIGGHGRILREHGEIATAPMSYWPVERRLAGTGDALYANAGSHTPRPVRICSRPSGRRRETGASTPPARMAV